MYGGRGHPMNWGENQCYESTEGDHKKRSIHVDIIIVAEGEVAVVIAWGMALTART